MGVKGKGVSLKTKQIGAAWFFPLWVLRGARMGCTSWCMLLAASPLFYPESRVGCLGFNEQQIGFFSSLQPNDLKIHLTSLLSCPGKLSRSSKSCSTGGKLRHGAATLFSSMPGWSHTSRSRPFPRYLSGLTLLPPLMGVFWQQKP